MFEIGKIVKPHGIKGALKIFPYTTHIERFKIGDVYYIDNNKYTVEDVGQLGKNVLLKFEEINDRNNAELFRNKIIKIDDNNLIPLYEDEYYLHDIMHCDVFDEDDFFMGKVIEIILIKNNNVLDIKKEDGSVLSIIFKKEFIEYLDIKNKKIKMKFKKSFYEI